MNPPPVDRAKRELRAVFRERARAAAAAATAAENDARVDFLLALPVWRTAWAVGLYLSRPDEAPTDELLRRCRVAGRRVAVPCPDGAGGVALSWLTEGDALRAGRWGIREPGIVRPAPPDALDLWIVPGLAFAAAGARLGRGGGYYDRLLAAAPGVKLGWAFVAQCAESLPVAPHDVRLDGVVTERGVWGPGASGP